MWCPARGPIPGNWAGSPEPGQEDPEHLPDPSGLSLPGRTALTPQREAGLPYLGGLGRGTGGASIKPVLLVKIAYRQRRRRQRLCLLWYGSWIFLIEWWYSRRNREGSDDLRGTTGGTACRSLPSGLGVSQARLRSDNGLGSDQPLVPGQALAVLVPTATYTVRPGDTLWGHCQTDGGAPPAPAPVQPPP